MASLTYTNYPGFGQQLSDQTHYSQAVILPGSSPAHKVIKTSGQGGWDPKTGALPDGTQPQGIYDQIDAAFANNETALKAAGGEGWGEVYQVRMFYVLNGERGSEGWKRDLERVLEAGGEVLRKWCPGHRPLLTAVEVRGLALEGMRVEVEVEALVEA